MPRNAIAKSAAGSSGLGRPRKISRQAIVVAAQQLIVESGFESLSMRSLAARLGVAHPTLYTYFEHIEDVEAEVLHALVAQLPRPSARSGAELRRELGAYLHAARALIARHPQVVLPPIGSPAWIEFVGMNLAWIDALAAHETDAAAARSAFNALIGFVAHDVERERVYGSDHRTRIAKTAKKHFPDAGLLDGGGTFQSVIDDLIHRMLPGLAAQSRTR